MLLRNLNIGDRFKLTENGLVWIKETEQGLDNNYSYCFSEKEIKNKARKTRWDRLFKQDINVIKI